MLARATWLALTIATLILVPAGIARANEPPHPSFSISPDPATPGQQVTFDASESTDPDGQLQNYDWDLDGDGSFETHTGTEAATSTSYEDEQTIVASLRVTDDQGLENVAGQAFAVSVNAFSPDDWDVDGCSNSQESGQDPAAGGRRDPENPYDFYDVPTGNATLALDNIVAISDIGALVVHFGGTEEQGGPGYSPVFDRSPPDGGAEPERREPWDLTAPDGVISVTDIGLMVRQFGHGCRVEPGVTSSRQWCDPDGDGQANVVERQTLDEPLPPEEDETAPDVPADAAATADNPWASYELTCALERDELGRPSDYELLTVKSGFANTGEQPFDPADLPEDVEPLLAETIEGSGPIPTGGPCYTGKEAACPRTWRRHTFARAPVAYSSRRCSRFSCISGDTRIYFAVNWRALYGSIYTGVIDPQSITIGSGGTGPNYMFLNDTAEIYLKWLPGWYHYRIKAWARITIAKTDDWGRITQRFTHECTVYVGPWGRAATLDNFCGRRG